jgi:diphthine-ammonia ligase
MSNNSSAWKGSTQLALYWLVDVAAVPRVLNACTAYTQVRFSPICMVHTLTALQEDKTPALLIGITALPKGAVIEKQVLLHTGQYFAQDEEDDEAVLKSQNSDFEYGEIAFVGHSFLTHPPRSDTRGR